MLEYGPYIVIDKGIALAHARPNDGVLKTGIALATFTPAVKFGSENDPVKIMIVLAAAGDNEHVELLAFIADLLGDENSIKAVSYTHLDVYKRQIILLCRELQLHMEVLEKNALNQELVFLD